MSSFPARTPLPLRKPRAVLGGWLGLVVVLALLGLSVEDRLTQSVLTVPGTESNRALELTDETFGSNAQIPVLLEGPPEELDRQGPELVAALSAEDDIRVISPWDDGDGGLTLRPQDDAAMILTAVEVPDQETFDEAAPRIIEFTEEHTSEPVEVRVSGMSAIGNGLKEEAYSAARSAERIAVPVLFIVLLVVFGSPVAAAIPALTGISSVLASFGAIWLLAGFLEIDPIAISLASMMGLALGVDYSLLLVSRFREEIHAGVSPGDGARIAGATAGRTVLFAGITLIAAMIVALIVAPGDLLLSAAVGVITATVISVATAMVAIPAALVLVGTNVDRWRIRRHAGEGSPVWLGGLRRVLRRPGLAAALIAIPFAILAAPAFGIDTGPPDVRNLPEDSRARQDFERIRAVMGPGWTATYTVVVAAEEGAITDRRRLREISEWEREVSKFDAVQVVVGPGAIREQTKALHGAERGLDRSEKGLTQLSQGLGRAERGVERLEAGLGDAEEAARQIAAGASLAAGETAAASPEDAFGRLQSAIGRAAGGATALSDGTDRFAEGAAELTDAIDAIAGAVSSRLESGAERLARKLEAGAGGLRRLAEPASVAAANLEDALRALRRMSIGKADPQYIAALEGVATAQGAITGRDPRDGSRVRRGYDGLASELRSASAKLGRGARGAGRLADGIGEVGDRLGQLGAGAERLRRGARRLDDGADRLASGLRRLDDELSGSGSSAPGGDEVAALVSGLQRLDSGASELASGLDRGESRTGQLEHGLDRLAGAAARFHGKVAQSRRQQRQRTPGLFDSGQFVLAALDGAEREDRERAEFAVNVDRGGQAGAVTVVPREGPNEPETQALRDDLINAAGDLADRTNTSTAVGGPAAHLADYDEATSERLPLLIGGLIAITFLVLIPIFRSLLLPLIAVGLNALTVAAAFGILALLFQGDNPLLGGPGYVDAIAISGIYTVIFGLSIDYEVFLLSRMREGWLRTGDPDEAIAYGLERTASVVTGAAAIMTAVFVAFAFTDVISTRQFGVGLVVAVLLDATIVRLVLLPALMRLAGEKVWWLPRWLDKRLPDLDVEGASALEPGTASSAAGRA